jgi:hypothetical protein
MMDRCKGIATMSPRGIPATMSPVALPPRHLHKEEDWRRDSRIGLAVASYSTLCLSRLGPSAWEKGEEEGDLSGISLILYGTVVAHMGRQGRPRRRGNWGGEEVVAAVMKEKWRTGLVGKKM